MPPIGPQKSRCVLSHGCLGSFGHYGCIYPLPGVMILRWRAAACSLLVGEISAEELVERFRYDRAIFSQSGRSFFLLESKFLMLVP